MCDPLPQGWQCPQCKRVFAPAVTECPYCQPDADTEPVERPAPYIPDSDVDYQG